MTDSSNTSSPMCIDLPVVHETVVPWSNIREVGSKLRLESDKVSHQVNTTLSLDVSKLKFVRYDTVSKNCEYDIDIDRNDIDVLDNIVAINCTLRLSINQLPIKKETIIPLVSLYWYDSIKLTASFSDKKSSFGFTATCGFLRSSERDIERARQYNSKYIDHQTWTSFIPKYPRNLGLLLCSNESISSWLCNRSRQNAMYSTTIEQLFKCTTQTAGVYAKGHTIRLPAGIIIDNIKPIRCSLRLSYGNHYMKDITVIPTVALKHTDVKLLMYPDSDYPSDDNRKEPFGYQAQYTQLPTEYTKEIMSGKLVECGGYRYFDGIIEIDRTGKPYKINQTNQTEKIECDKSVPCLICNNCDKPIRPKQNILSDIRSICNEDSLDSTKKISILQTMLTSEEETLPVDV